MAQSPEEMLKTMIANLPAKTGRSLEDWRKLLADRGLSAHKEIMAFLKSDQGVTHGYANTISQLARQAEQGGAPAGEDLVAGQYSGAKESLRPIYEALAGAVHDFGPDVELAPKKAYVSLRRGKQFGIVQPSTRTRVDVGINLKGRPPSGRLEASGSFNAMVTHRVRLTAVGDVDDELLGWLRKAYGEA